MSPTVRSYTSYIGRFAAVIILLFFLAPPTQAAPQPQAVLNRCYTIADDAGQLVTLERLPAPTILNSVGLVRGGAPTHNELESLAYDLAGTLLLSAIQTDPDKELDGLAGSILVTIDPATGLVTDVGTGLDHGTLDNTFSGSLGDIKSGQVTGLAFEQAEAGLVLWAVAKDAGPGGHAAILYQVDPAAGQHVSDAFGEGVDYLAITGLLETRNKIVEDIAISPSGDVLVETRSRLYRLDTATGAVTLVAEFSPASQQMEGLSFAPDGVLYATQGESGGETNELDTVNPATAARTTLLNLPTFGSPAEGDYESITCLTAPMVEEGADLSASLAADRPKYKAGQPVIYTVTIANAGPLPVTAALVEANKPSQVTSWTWVCTAQNGGATDCTPSAAGITTNFLDSVNLPAGGSVTYTVTANNSIKAVGPLTLTVQVTPPLSTFDPLLDNNQATLTTPGGLTFYYFPQVFKRCGAGISCNPNPFYPYGSGD